MNKIRDVVFVKSSTCIIEMFCSVRQEQYIPLLTASVWLFSVVLLSSFEDIKIACSYLKPTAL